MAETSGFFDAVWDETIYNEDTGEMGDYDLKYLAKQFADYFALFIGNGVFGSPTNRLMVLVAETDNAMQIKVTEGWAFINGQWYHNDSDKLMTVPLNSSADNRADSVMIRYDETTRQITAVYVPGSVEVIRNGVYYDLKIAEVLVPVAANAVLQSNITDTRPNEDVCGFVTSLLKVQTTKDLFAQYEAIFNEWFDTIKETLDENAAYQLQRQIGNLEDLLTADKVDLVTAINELFVKVSSTSNVTEFLLCDQKELEFVDKVCTIIDDRIKENSLADVYVTGDTYETASIAVITPETYDTYLQITCENVPTGTIKASITIKVVNEE